MSQYDDSPPDPYGAADADFEQIVAGYAHHPELTNITDPRVEWPVPPVPTREHVDLGVAGSLIQRRNVLRRHRRVNTTARTHLLAGLVGLVGLIATTGLLAEPTLPLAYRLGAVALLIIGVGLIVLHVYRSNPVLRELNQSIEAELAAHSTLTRRLAGTGWTIHSDRLIPGTEQRVAFIATGPGGLVVLPALPPGEYGVENGYFTVDGKPIPTWFIWREAEARQLLRVLIDTPTRDLHYQGPLYWRWLRIHPAKTQLPLLLDERVPLLDPRGAAEDLLAMSSLYGHHQIQALAELVDQTCLPAPQADDGATRS